MFNIFLVILKIFNFLPITASTPSLGGAVSALEQRASDIHIEPFEKELRIRYRIDGILHDIDAPPRKLQAALISRVKLMAKLNIAERRLPQDGRIKLRMLGREIDLRVSSLPTLYGESVVLRTE